MIKTFFLCILLLSARAVFSQTEPVSPPDSTVNGSNIFNKVFSAVVEMDIDSTIYPVRSGNSFMSETPRGAIVAIVAPQSFEIIQQKQKDGKNFTVKDQGEFEAHGTRIAFKTGVLKRNGSKWFTEQYTIMVDQRRTIIVTGMCDPKAKETFSGTFRKAAISARIK